MFPIDLPWIPGHEFAGVVERVGRNVESFAPGDSVFGNSQSGAYAEYLAVKPATIAKKPSNLSYDEAASVPVAAQTAWQGLFNHAHLAQGQTVLIHGGAGSVGAYAVQLAAQAGATVVVTAIGEDDTYLKSLGANRVIDYQASRFESELPDKVDVVFDLIGGETQQRSFQVLRKGGYLIAANQPVPQEQAIKYGVTGLMMSFVPSAQDLGRIARLLEERKLRPDVARTYALDDTVRAWQEMAGGPESAAKTRRRHGKVVLRVA
jgi:NADPH:quinone reductase-like Zn-dependent oxidoreductase